MNAFQTECIAAIREGLHLRAEELPFKLTVGKSESYLVGDTVVGSTAVQIFIYEDEVGVMEVNDEWHIWEAPDFDSYSDLIRSAVRFLITLAGRPR